jgi:SAM-dependent methyltransferase
MSRSAEPPSPFPDVSEQVRAFYDQYPYPPPVDQLEEYRQLWQDPKRRRADYHLFWPTRPYKEDQSILVAGCGTSQAAKHALRWPEAQVTGIDCSATSARSTEELKRKYSLKNLQVRQLAVEQVNDLGMSFDQIVCTGVLHHLADPDAGLSALASVLKPDGAMQLMVYAPYGRAGIYMVQEFCKRLGIRATDAEIRDLITALGSLPPGHPLETLLRHAPDFRHEAALADALLHPQDRAYTVPQIYAWLERCGLSFGRWFEQAPYLPQCGAIARTPHAARLASLSPPLQHAAVELLRGTMAKHNFIAYRDDRRGASQPITFDGNAWRAYVPLRLPWTLCIRDSVPPGFVAVLINRAHTYPDLALPIDSAQEQIYAAIDGNRSIDEILRGAAGAGGDEQGRRFIQQLWEYDQIVLDATSSR